MAVATQPDLRARLGAVREFTKAHNVERKEEEDLLWLSILAGVDVLLLGEPGVGKTYLIEMIVQHCLADMEMFSHLLAKDMSADEVLGPKDIMAMKEGRIHRLTAGYAPDAHVAYLDEVFKASPPLLNPLLDLLANRILKMGGETKDCKQLIAIAMSSNELPDREDLQAFRDRIGITKKVEPVRTAEGRRRVTDIQLGQQAHGLDTTEIVPLTLEDIMAIREEIARLTVPDVIRDKMNEAQQKWLEKGHPPSQRRVGQMWRVVKAHAWMAGRDTVSADDLMPCQHMAWNKPDDQKSAREVIVELASAFTRKAEELRQALEPVLSSMDELRAQIDAADTEEDRDKLMEGGFKFLQQLRRLKKRAEQQIREGETQGEDVETAREVLAEIEKSYDWAQSVLSAADDE